MKPRHVQYSSRRPKSSSQTSKVPVSTKPSRAAKPLSIHHLEGTAAFLKPTLSFWVLPSMAEWTTEVNLSRLAFGSRLNVCDPRGRGAAGRIKYPVRYITSYIKHQILYHWFHWEGYPLEGDMKMADITWQKLVSYDGVEILKPTECLAGDPFEWSADKLVSLTVLQLVSYCSRLLQPKTLDVFASAGQSAIG